MQLQWAQRQEVDGGTSIRRLVQRMNISALLAAKLAKF